MSGRRRLRAMMVGCPKCRVPPGVACTGRRGARTAPHIERMKASPPPGVAIPSRAAPQPVECFYTSDAWRAVRYEALRVSRGICECCGAGPEPGRPLHVDHIKPRSKFPALALAVSNLQILCVDCNLGKSNRDSTDWRTPRAST